MDLSFGLRLSKFLPNFVSNSCPTFCPKNGVHYTENIQSKFSHIIELIEEVGPKEVGMPHIKALGQGLFEIRVKSDEGIARALFGMIKGQVIIILCGFIKKTQKTPSREIELARERMKEIKNEQKTNF